MQMELEELRHFFPELNDAQMRLFADLPPLYAEWNARVNLISRKDTEHFLERHLLHSLALTYFLRPNPGDRLLDIGTGGGFPGIPLAIRYPECQFHLVDSIGKKIKVVNEIAGELGLSNVKAEQARVESLKGKYRYGVTRAVARLRVLADWCAQPGLSITSIYCLKGGELSEEVDEVSEYPCMVHDLSRRLDRPFFETKKVVHMQLS